MKGYDVSVIVPTRNRSAMLPQLFASLTAQTLPKEQWELIVVDDGATDDTKATLEHLAKTALMQVTLLHEDWQGAGGARNAGAERASGRVLLFLDDDMIATPDLVAEHACHHDGPGNAVLGRIGSPRTRRNPWTSWEDSQFELRANAIADGRRKLGPRDFYTGNCSVSADLFRTIGGFNPRLQRAEDLEFGYRLASAGARFSYSARAESIHVGEHPFERWVETARALGKAEIELGWELGHQDAREGMSSEYFRRHRLNRWLVRACSVDRRLETPAIAFIHYVGRFGHLLGARTISSAAYSAIFNLAYWLSIIDGLGSDEFWHHLRQARAAAHTYGLQD